MPNDRVYEPIALEVPSHYDDDTVVIEGKTFTCMAPGQTAITVRWPYAESIAKVSIVIHRCFFEPGIHEWRRLVKLVNAWNPVIDTVGNVSGPTGVLEDAIVFDGCTMDAKVSKAHISHAVTAFRVTGESEGPTFHDCRALACAYGIYADTEQGEAGLFASDCHFAVSANGIYARNRPQVNLHDLLIYRHPWRAGTDFIGVNLGEGSEDADVHDVKVKLFGHRGIEMLAHPSLQRVDRRNVRTI